MNNAQNTFLSDGALVAQMLPDQLHVWDRFVLYSIDVLGMKKLFGSESMDDRLGHLAHLPVIIRVFKQIGHLNN